MVAQMVSDLYLPLSQVRLEAYRPLGGSDLDMLTNYFWNIELALRNSIHTALTNHYGTDMWFTLPGLLGAGQVIEFNTAHRRVARNPPVTSGKLVSELNFGFWVTLLSGPYEQPLWRPNRYARSARRSRMS